MRPTPRTHRPSPRRLPPCCASSPRRTGVDAGALPAFDGALDLARAGVETGGAAHNRRYVLPALTLESGVAQELVTLAHDPQTSGGLLAAIPPVSIARVEADLDARGVTHWRVGHVEESGDGGDGVALV